MALFLSHVWKQNHFSCFLVLFFLVGGGGKGTLILTEDFKVFKANVTKRITRKFKLNIDGKGHGTCWLIAHLRLDKAQKQTFPKVSPCTPLGEP